MAARRSICARCCCSSIATCSASAFSTGAVGFVFHVPARLLGVHADRRQDRRGARLHPRRTGSRRSNNICAPSGSSYERGKARRAGGARLLLAGQRFQRPEPEFHCAGDARLTTSSSFASSRAIGAPGAAHVPRRRRDWVDLGFAEARYLDIGRFGARGLAALLKQTPHDALWLNSVYDREFTLPALCACAPRPEPRRRRSLLSPRGEFGVGRARSEGRPKKQVFLAPRPHARPVARPHLARHQRGGGEGHRRPRRRRRARYRRRPQSPAHAGRRRRSQPSRARRCASFSSAASRRSRAATSRWRRSRACARPSTFDIFGPPEDDATYWRRARARRRLAAAHRAFTGEARRATRRLLEAHRGAPICSSCRPPARISATPFSRRSPAACPSLISDQTPWRGLAPRAPAGICHLPRPEAFVAAIECFAAHRPRRRARTGARARERRAGLCRTRAAPWSARSARCCARIDGA